MAKVRRINVGVRFCKNLGNYQTVTLEAGAELELEESEDEKKVYEKAWDLVGDEISEQLKLFQDTNKGVKKGLK